MECVARDRFFPHDDGSSHVTRSDGHRDLSEAVKITDNHSKV